MEETLWKQKMNQSHTCLETTLIRFWETEKYRQIKESLQHVYFLTIHWYFLYLLPFPQSSPKIQITRPITSSLVRTWLPHYLPPNLHPTVSSKIWGVRHRRMMLAFAIEKIIGDFCIAKSTVSSQSSRLLTDIQPVDWPSSSSFTRIFHWVFMTTTSWSSFHLAGPLLVPFPPPDHWTLECLRPQFSDCFFSYAPSCRGSYQILPTLIDDFQICLQCWLIAETQHFTANCLLDINT